MISFSAFYSRLIATLAFRTNCNEFFSPVEETYGIDEEGPETLEDPPSTLGVPEVNFQLI